MKLLSNALLASVAFNLTREDGLPKEAPATARLATCWPVVLTGKEKRIFSYFFLLFMWTYSRMNGDALFPPECCKELKFGLNKEKYKAQPFFTTQSRDIAGE